jgi:hypothetical protein
MDLLTGKHTAHTKPAGDDVRGEKKPESEAYSEDGKPSPE